MNFMDKKEIQETLQKFFDSECRSYIIYSKRREMLEKFFSSFDQDMAEIEKQMPYEKKNLTFDQLAVSEEFWNLMVLYNTPNAGKEFEKAIKEIETARIELDEKIKELKEQQIIFMRMAKINSNTIDVIISNLDWIIKCVKAAEVKMSFNESPIVDVAYRVFVHYYAVPYNFISCRNVLNIKNTNFSEEFKKAYLAETEEEKRRAFDWFVKEAKRNYF